MATSPATKRKRDIIPDDDDAKLEIDVNLPEPPSKKAKRKEKKEKKSKPIKTEDGEEADSDTKSKPVVPSSTTAPSNSGPVRSPHGIWIGNLPYSATNASLRDFLLKTGGISDADITRIHLPLNERKQSKGFAYVDFTSPAVLDIALALSEKLFTGRACLIKNANSFEGRPKVTAAAEAAKVSEKEPSKRIFVGNLGFDTTREELGEHFKQAGQVDDVFLATFEDSGKCKGFGWVTFGDIEAASQAVRGYIYKKHIDERDEESADEEENQVEGSDEEDGKPKRKPRKPMKWFINRYQGREMKLEFAEDKQTRYKKRYGGKGAPAEGGERGQRGESRGGAERGAGGSARYHDAPGENLADLVREAQDAAPKKRDPKLKKMHPDERQEYRRKRHDARNVAPGKALANTQRSGKASGAIVAGAGTKKTFE